MGFVESSQNECYNNLTNYFILKTKYKTIQERGKNYGAIRNGRHWLDHRCLY